jgi:hypothetical protein
VRAAPVSERRLDTDYFILTIAAANCQWGAAEAAFLAGRSLFLQQRTEGDDRRTAAATPEADAQISGLRKRNPDRFVAVSSGVTCQQVFGKRRDFSDCRADAELIKRE